MDLFSITIPNWQEYNARNDRANYSWFRFQNDFFQNQKLFGLTDSQWILFLILICEVSKKNKDTVDMSLHYIAALRTTTVQKIAKDLQELARRGVVVTAKSRGLVAEGRASATKSLATYIHTDRQTDRHNTIADRRPALDFLLIYSAYPRKEGKQRGMALCKAQIKTQEDFDSLASAVKRYVEHIKSQAIEPKFIKHFSSFMFGGHWRDWLDLQTGTSDGVKKQTVLELLQDLEAKEKAGVTNG